MTGEMGCADSCGHLVSEEVEAPGNGREGLMSAEPSGRTIFRAHQGGKGGTSR